MPVVNPSELIANRIAAIATFHNKVGIPKAQLDVSGGVDSAVMLGLLAGALGPENITAVYSGINSSRASKERAKLVAKTFGVSLVYINLTEIYEGLVKLMMESLAEAGGLEKERLGGFPSDEAYLKFHDIKDFTKNDPTILGSIRSCLRAPVGRGFNRLAGGGIRHGTGNECEDRWLRFYQKGGDGEVDSNPLAMLSKGEVFQLGLALGVPREVLGATPSPDLWGTGEAGHSDEDEISDYLKVDAAGLDLTWYSYIDLETGAYTKVGLIERVSRFIDTKITNESDWDNPTDFTVGSWMFEPRDKVHDWTSLAAIAAYGDFPRGLTPPSRFRNADPTTAFKDFPPGLLIQLFKAVNKVEAATRHKHNPAIPTLGDRSDLVEAGILTNDLPHLLTV